MFFLAPGMAAEVPEVEDWETVDVDSLKIEEAPPAAPTTTTRTTRTTQEDSDGWHDGSSGSGSGASKAVRR